MKQKVEKLLIAPTLTVKEAIRRMDETGEKILFVVDANLKLLGSITDGDLRRFILREGRLSQDVTQVYNASPLVAHKNDDELSLRETMVKRKIVGLPVVDEQCRLIDVIFASELLSEDHEKKIAKLDVPVLVMAGGKGTRLEPFTKILPKPLIPLGDKPIIEVIMDRFAEFGCSDFLLTVNYKGKMIQSYFDNAECPYGVRFLWEEMPLGTAGSIRLASAHLQAPHLFVSNCDILIKADYADIHQFHVASKNDITVVGSMQHVSVPYGVLEMENGGNLKNIIEKPEYDLLVNTGMYLIKKEVINSIPENVKCDFTELMLRVKNNGGKVGVYPISQQSWIDLGQWQEYHNAIKHLEA